MDCPLDLYSFCSLNNGNRWATAAKTATYIVYSKDNKQVLLEFTRYIFILLDIYKREDLEMTRMRYICFPQQPIQLVTICGGNRIACGTYCMSQPEVNV